MQRVYHDYMSTTRTLFGSTGRRIKILRNDLGMNQGELARAASALGVPISQSALSRWESDETSPPGNMLAAVARALETSTDYLLMMSDDPTPAGEQEEDLPMVHERREAYLADEDRNLLDLWRSLDAEQRTFVLDVLDKLRRWSAPRVIGGAP